MNKKTILITGWLWYIGSHAVVAFEEAWYKCVIIDNLWNSCLSTIRNIGKILWYNPDFHEVDLRDKRKLEEVFMKYDFDGVIHFAGLKSPWESQEKALMYFDNNISWSIVLFELMEKYKVKNIVFSSSANTYCSSNIPPILETDIQSPSNPYGTTKLLLEKILNDLAEFSHFKVTHLRYFNPIGAHKSWLLWEDPEDIPNNLFPFIFQTARGQRECLEIFGKDYDTIDGTGVRDYIDVCDLVDAHIKAYEVWSSALENYCDVFNIGTGKWISVLQAVESIEKQLWIKINYVFSPRRAGDIPVSYCNANKAKTILWWEAKTSFYESLENSWNFYNK